MLIDYGSVLLAVGTAGAALCVTLMLNWLRERAAGFLLTWAMAMGIVVASMALFSAFTASGGYAAGFAACVLLVAGLAVAYGGMTQFRDGTLDPVRLGGLVAVASAPVAIAYGLGFDGAAFWMVNFMSAILLVASGLGYWRMRAESMTALSSIAALHWGLAVSFVLCGIVAMVQAPLHLTDGMPENWAEVVNLVCGIIAITGIGGLLITVYQERISRRHQTNSLTDPLTGLSNRRALFDRFDTGTVPVGTALIIFDLDDFKSLNDRFGHGFGDEVLCRFAALLKSNTVPADAAVRLGGEEFALVLSGSSPERAAALAETVRVTLASLSYRLDGTIVTCTVSAGVAVAEKPGQSFDRLLRKADTALYLSKRNGRNRVTPTVSSSAA